MIQDQVSWLSLWPTFFEEGVDATLRSFRHSHRELSSAVSAIILTRTSWEAFSNELIEQRGLEDDMKQLHTGQKLSRIYMTLEGNEIRPEENETWSNLLLISALRNSAIHFDTRVRPTRESPRDIARRLSAIGVIELSDSKEWERQVYCARVAYWCCVQVGKAIETLERLEGRQFRPPATISKRIDDLLAPLKEVRYV